jgi:FixJ family two-component response regulator
MVGQVEASIETAGVRTGPSVCVVDDDPSLRRALQRLLRASGLRVIAFPSAEAFLAAGVPDDAGCLVLDVHLGGLSGFDLYDRLAEQGSKVPVIFITAHDDAPSRERARKTGAVAYLRKPFDDRQLIDAILWSLAHPPAA